MDRHTSKTGTGFAIIVDIECAADLKNNIKSQKIINENTYLNQPKITQIGWILFNRSTFEIIRHRNEYINPTESGERVNSNQVPFKDILIDFAADVLKAKCLVGHNINHDIRGILSDFVREADKCQLTGNTIEAIHLMNMVQYITNLERYCTMQNTTDWCKLPLKPKYTKDAVKGKYKWPKLTELHHKLFPIPLNEHFLRTHISITDCLITLRCYVKFVYGVDLYDESDTFGKYVAMYQDPHKKNPNSGLYL